MNDQPDQNRTRERGEAYKAAEARVEKKLGFYHHLITYALVNVLLIVVNLITWSGFPWFIFPLVGWGIGLAGHAFQVFELGGGRMKRIKDKMIQDELNKRQ
jgi:hypothetical protein